jgi:hypothetical protein
MEVFSLALAGIDEFGTDPKVIQVLPFVAEVLFQRL